MKYIPHDYYLKFMSSMVHEDVLEFHSKGNYTIHDAFKHVSRLHNIDDKSLSILTGNELRLYPDLDLTFPIRSTFDSNSDIARSESCNTFSSRSLSFSLLESLVAPVLTNRADSFKRGYPSGGALYPVEVFICSLIDNEESWPCPEKVLHLLPNSRAFEVIQGTENVRYIKEAILSFSGQIGQPPVAVIYAVYIPKTLFKYKYRGYRLALMEVGSIYMLIELQAKKLGLGCRLWSAYTDTMLCKAIGLNPALFFPMCVHFIGECHDSL
jgi:SagB-type dehydrogenase family enzyme